MTRKEEEIKKLDSKVKETVNRLTDVEGQLGATHEKAARIDKEKKRVEGELSECKQDLDKEKRAKADLGKHLNKRVCKHVDNSSML